MTTPKPPDAPPQLTLLFVDDEEALTRAITRVLAARKDLTLFTAASGAQALAILRAHSVDVLVSDIDMPGMSGLELVRIARREFPATLRILLTGAGTMDRALSAINEGEVVRFFAKPFDADAFSRALRELGERILLLRRERHAEAQRARCEELFRWIEERYPGTLELTRSDDGALVVDSRALRTYLRSAPPEIGAALDVAELRPAV